ncbi:uncharacterized protein I206_100129 [Kwoniella pini CBS 10737]|uniref:Uncharacterized protein n=1 Tax=Kwoniella pini CBS 10737 TaxID=1296096 RepID=A0A1B9IEM5_9TREE|nr:uncharacterized protein I206_01198 [Kwoniella pini CBS 10737]OCF53891.1 hypothetical protein I206_01198 [Kwoniella pini CBS 10737]
MSSLKFSEVIFCLEKTDPCHPPAFYNALEVVKRYSRAKIAKGSGRQLVCKNGRLETLENKFAKLGFQDIFYLTRLQLKLPPSSLRLPPPSCFVGQTLLKAGYPLPFDTCQNECASSSKRLSTSPRAVNNSSKPYNQGRRGSKSLNNSPILGESIHAIRRTSSSIPDLPALATSMAKSKSTGNSSNRKSSSQWTPSGLGLRPIPQDEFKYNDNHIDTLTLSPETAKEIAFNLNPFGAPLLDIVTLKTSDSKQNMGNEEDEELVPIGLILNQSRNSEEIRRLSTTQIGCVKSYRNPTLDEIELIEGYSYFGI